MEAVLVAVAALALAGAAALLLLSRHPAEAPTGAPGAGARAALEQARAQAAEIGDVAPTADQLMADAIQRQDASHADGAPRAGALALEGLPDDARERLLGALEVVAMDTFTEVGVDDERQQVTLRGLDPVGREVA